jgi:hypothetical protein
MWQPPDAASEDTTMMPTPDTQDHGTTSPRIEFLYFAACPHGPTALALLREVLGAEGCSAEVELIAVETEEAAARQRFFGSPTIRINGHDVGSLPPQATPTLACRLYAQPDGRLAPHPPLGALREAIQQACTDSAAS